jgi:hypothetical protein
MKNPGTPISWLLRLWFVVETLFGLGAILTITLFPANTANNFAWDIQPVVMAAVIGAYYVAAASIIVPPLLARRWEMVRVLILPSVLFTSLLLLATLLHWSRFRLGTTAFNVWFLSYLLPPPIYLALYFAHERRARRAPTPPPSEPLPPDVRRALLHWGGLLALLTIIIFIFPRLLIAVAPWTMTPLTTRVLVSWLFAAGALMLSMARENDRTRVLLAVPMLVLMFPMVTLQLARFAGQVNFANPALFVGYAIMLVAGVIGLYLARGNWVKALT